MNQDLQELMDVGGGQTGTTKVPEPVAKKATLPNSKDQGDKSVIKGATAVGQDKQEDTNSENNTKPTGDMSAQNKSSVSMKEEIKGLFLGQDLSEEFKEKATTIFEAAVHAKVEELREQRPELLPSQVPMDTDIERMGVHRQPVTAMFPKSRPARAYQSLWDDIVERL
jgi:hypothetical protein